MWTQRQTYPGRRPVPAGLRLPQAQRRPGAGGGLDRGPETLGLDFRSRSGGSTLLSLKASSCGSSLGQLSRKTQKLRPTPPLRLGTPSGSSRPQLLSWVFTNDSRSPWFYFASPLSVPTERKAVHRRGQNAAALFKMKQTPR